MLVVGAGVGVDHWAIRVNVAGRAVVPEPGRQSTARSSCRAKSLALGGRHQREAGGEQIRERHSGGLVGTDIAHGDGVRDHVADIRSGVADRLGDDQVGLLRRFRGTGAVVGRDGIELIAVRDGRRVSRRGRTRPRLQSG